MLWEKHYRRWQEKTGYLFCGKFLGLLCFSINVPGLGERRFENAAQARKMLSGIGKRKGLARKKCSGGDWNYGDFAGCRCISCRIRAAGSFESALAEVTKGILRDRGK